MFAAAVLGASAAGLNLSGEWWAVALLLAFVSAVGEVVGRAVADTFRPG